jgi:hypothetical protein
MVNRTFGEPASQLRERHDAADFLTDLQMFVQETPCQTMACLDAPRTRRPEGPHEQRRAAVDLPRRPRQPAHRSGVIDEEYAAFLAWIEATAACGLCYTGDAPCGEPASE